MISIPRSVFAVVFILMGACGFSSKAQTTTNAGAQDATAKIGDIADLEQTFADLQYQFLPITPPGMNLLVQPYGGALPFDWKAFPQDFTDGLIGEYQYGKIPVYGITVLEDPITRYTLFLNADKEIFYSLPPPKGYDSTAYAMAKMPALFSGTLSAQDVTDFSWLYDPARVAGVFSLVPSENWTDFQDYEAEAAAASSSKGGGGMMLMMTPSNTNDFYIFSLALTNGMEVGVNVPAGTNFTVDIFNFDATSNNTFNGLVSVWAIAVTNLVAVSNIVVWTDTTYTNSINRFYGAGNGDLDTDGDGLRDDREIFRYKSNPNLLDTDGDGMNDGVEVAQGYDPAVSNAAAKVWIRSPLGGEVLP